MCLNETYHNEWSVDKYTSFKATVILHKNNGTTLGVRCALLIYMAIEYDVSVQSTWFQIFV